MSEAKSSRFSAGLRSLQEVGGKAAPLKLTEASPEPEVIVEPTQATKGAKPRQASRVGKENVSLWVDPAVTKQLALLAIEQDCYRQDLLVEALNLLFERYGKSPIAKG